MPGESSTDVKDNDLIITDPAFVRSDPLSAGRSQCDRLGGGALIRCRGGSGVLPRWRSTTDGPAVEREEEQIIDHCATVVVVPTVVAKDNIGKIKHATCFISNRTITAVSNKNPGGFY